MGQILVNQHQLKSLHELTFKKTEEVCEVYVGARYVVLKTDQNTFYVWEMNPSGVFGNGTTIDALNPTSLTDSFHVTEVLNIYTEIKDYNSLIEFITTRDGYTFTGCYLDPYLAILFEGITVPAQDLVLYAGL